MLLINSKNMYHTNSGMSKRFSLLQNRPEWFWDPHSLLFVGYRGSFPWIKRPGRPAIGHLQPPSAEAQYSWRYTSTSPTTGCHCALCINVAASSSLYFYGGTSVCPFIITYNRGVFNMSTWVIYTFITNNTTYINPDFKFISVYHVRSHALQCSRTDFLQFCFFFNGSTAPWGPRQPHFSRLHDHTHLRHTTVGRTPLDEGPARRKDLYLTTHNIHNRQTSMPPAGFEHTIPVSERPQTHALDRAATGIGYTSVTGENI
jgi:hypothetical protein